MSKRVYISADYAENNGDRDVVNELHAWGKDNKHKVDPFLAFISINPQNKLP